MSKNWIVLTGLLFLGLVGTSQAHPLDSPDIVYIDGLPCNSACQSYLAWSRQKTSGEVRHAAPVETAPAQSAHTKLAPRKPVLRSAHGAARPAKTVQQRSAKPAAARIAKQVVPTSPAEIAAPKPAADATVTADPAPAKVERSLPPDGAAAASESRTVQEQVAAATALAEQMTAAGTPPAPQSEAANTEASKAEAAANTGAGGPGDDEPTVSVATGNTDNRVAVVATRPEIESVSDLAGRDVAIEDQQSASSTSIRDAIASAGAAEVKLNEGPARAIDRLVGGEVPAAVLALVSPEAAEGFPDIPGYRIFRIPISPGASKARL